MSINVMKHTIHKWGEGDISSIYGGCLWTPKYLNPNQKMKISVKMFLKKN